MSIHHDSPDDSPDFLDVGNEKSGGRRLNKLPLICMVVGGMLVVGLVSYIYNTKLHSTPNSDLQRTRQAENKQAEPGSPPQFGSNSKPQEESASSDSKQSQSGQSGFHHEEGPHGGQDNQPAGKEKSALWEQYEKEKAKVLELRSAALMAALDSPTTMENPGNTTRPEQRTSSEKGYLSRSGANSAFSNEKKETSKSHSKEAWLSRNGTTSQHYLLETRQKPLSPYEVKAGTVIPSEMISGIQSDLPGQLIAQVRENVYDTATGQHLLIPQGARLVGTYDSAVSMGQERVLVAWNRVIYPDASSLTLGMMPGSDAGGYAGFQDKVNNHYMKVFGSAIFMSLFSAGVQLSQPQATNGENYSSSQIIAASLGQQMGELGMEMARRGVDIPPTIEIRPGYKFNIMVTKDIILEPWRDEK